jgi:membrane protease YdiL (CAAX protease family)
MINSIKETGQDLWAFIKNPVDQKDSIQSWQHKAKRLFYVLIIDVLFMLILIPIISGIGKLGLVDLENNKNLILFQLPLDQLVLFGVVFVPLIEELIFRLYLRFKHNFLARLIILLASITGKQKKSKIESQLFLFWERRFRGIFYFSVIVFGMVHLLNFDYSLNLLLLAPVIIAPQLIIGLFLGFLRVKHNLLLGFFLHAIHNAIFLIIPLLFMDQTIEKLNIKNKDYSLKIEQPLLKDISHASSTFGDDEYTFKEIALKSIIAFAVEKDEMLIENDNPLSINANVNLHFKNHSKNQSKNKQILLYNLSKAFDFRIENIKKRRSIWELCVLDSLALKKHQSSISSKPGYNSNIGISSDSIIFKNATIASIVNTLTSEYDKYIINNTNIQGYFNLKIPKEGFKALEKTLNTKYGLTLKKKEKELEYTYVHFLKD